MSIEEKLREIHSQAHNLPRTGTADRIATLAEEALREYVSQRPTLEQLRGIEFAAEGYCPACAGWEVEKGRGEKPKVHTQDCWLAKAISGISSSGSET